MCRNDPVILAPSHAGMLDRFLLRHAGSSLILLSNSRTAGLDDQGKIFQGTYAAVLDGGEIAGVAAHFWNGMVFLQAPVNAPGLVRAAVAASGRECTGIAGPYDQVQQALPVVLKHGCAPAMNSRDTLFSLDLNELVVPGLLVRSDIACRHPADTEIPGLIDLRIAYMKELTGTDLRLSVGAEARDLVQSQQEAGNLWVLVRDQTIVATTAIGAESAGMVQVGGVYTHPDCRNRGYGRAVVAGSLLEARDRGARTAILFTGTDMPAARAAYRALGFLPIGEYGLVMI